MPAAEIDRADLQLAGDLVTQAGGLAARMLAEGLQTYRKSSISDVVSAADHAAEELVVKRLRTERGADGLVGEEGASEPSRSGRTWFIDPVDGTYNFLSGLPSWCSAVALTDDPAPDYQASDIVDRSARAYVRLGAVFHPAADELWLGGPNVPTSCNGVAVPRLAEQPLAQLSIASYLHPATLPIADTREPLLAAMGAAATVRMLGSGSLELAAVAAGRLGAWVQHSSLDWDWYPGAALVRGAGGVAETFAQRGHRWHVAGNALVVAELTELIRAA